MTQRKIVNVSGDDLIVPWLDGRVVLAGEVVLVAEEDLAAYLSQPLWEAGDGETAELYSQVVAEAEQVAAAAAEEHAAAHPTPFDPGPPALGVDSFVPLAEQPEAVVERLGGSDTTGEEVVEREQLEAAAPQRTAVPTAPQRTAAPAAPAVVEPDPTPSPAVEPEAPAAVEPEAPAAVEPAPSAVDFAADTQRGTYRGSYSSSLTPAEQAADRTNAPAETTLSGILQLPRAPRL